MKRLLFAGACLVALVGSAIAADMPLKAPVYVAPAFSWTGCYIGGNAGSVWENDHTKVTGTSAAGAAIIAAGVVPANFDYKRSSSLMGGQIGCNYQVSRWVAGLETDFGGTLLNGNQTNNTNVGGIPSLTSNASQSIGWLGTTRGRLGVTFDNFLFYGTAGVAYGKSDYVYGQNNQAGGGIVSFSAADSATQVGWTAGGGIEMGWAQWSMRGEALYYDLGDHTLNSVCGLAAGGPCAPSATFATKFQNKGGIARISVNYKLW
jgi:outer membrane immunogenic protein